MELRLRDPLARAIALALLGGTASVAAAAPATTSTGIVTPSIYCCSASDGKNYCSDVLPTQCYGREYREMSRAGRVLKVVPAPLTAEQRAAKAAAAEENERKLAEAKELQRRDSALLATYTKVEEIDTRRERDLAEIERAVGLLQEREELILNKRKTLDRDKAFHKEGKLPDNLVKSIDANTRDLANVQELITTKQNEATQTKARYDAERIRFLELTNAKKP